MKKIRIKILLIVLPFLFLSFNKIDKNVEELLQKISSAYDNYNFIKKGFITYYRNGEPNSEYEYNIYNDSGDYTLTVFKNIKEGKTLKTIKTRKFILRERNGKYYKSSRAHYLGSEFLNEELLKLMKENYMFKICSDNTILDKKTVTLTVKSTVNYKPWVKLWVDKDSGLVLKMIVYNHKNDLASLYEVNSLDLNPNFDRSIFEIPEDKIEESKTKSIYYNSIDEIKNNIKAPVASMNSILSEYKPIKIRTFEAKGSFRIHIKYTDGLSDISVFQRKASEKDLKKKNKLTIKRMNLDTMLMKVSHGYLFAMIGDISEEMLIITFNSMLDQFETDLANLK